MPLLLLNLVCLTVSYEERMVFVGANFEMRCNGPKTSGTYDSCEDTDRHSLDVQNSYISSFTLNNVSLEDAGEYVIYAQLENKSCACLT